MRKIMSISLPSSMAKIVRNAVKTENYSSVSEFFRDLVRDWQEENTNQNQRKSSRSAIQQYAWNRNWKKLQKYGKRTARKKNLKEEDLEALIDEMRR